jgi:hypothetical protein
MQLMTHLHLASRLRMSGTVPPLCVCLHSMYRDSFTSIFFLLSSSNELHLFLQALLMENKITFVSYRCIMIETTLWATLW